MKVSSPALMVFALIASTAIATPIPWALSPTTLDGCCIPPLSDQTATVSGSFVFDAQTRAYSTWRFDIAGYTDPLTPLNGTLTPETSSIVVGGPTFLDLSYLSGQGHLTMTFGYLTMGGVVEVPLTDAGGTVPALVTNSAVFVSFFATGRSTISSVPEPVAGFMVLAGAAALCLSRRRFGRKRSGT